MGDDTNLLAAVGITRDELLTRVVERITNEVMLKEMQGEEEGARYSYSADSDIAEVLNVHVKAAIDERVSALAQQFVIPQVGVLIENFKVQKTNEWGEARGGAQTFVEYLTARADAYMREPVDSDGRSEQEAKSRGNSWYGNKNKPRLSYMIDKHLQFHIEQAMTAMLRDLNSTVAKGLNEMVQGTITELLGKIKVGVTVGR